MIYTNFEIILIHYTSKKKKKKKNKDTREMHTQRKSQGEDTVKRELLQGTTQDSCPGDTNSLAS